MSYRTTRRLVTYLLLSLFFGALVCVFGVRDLRAQAETGQVAGTVTDQSGAVVPNAKVTVTSQATASLRTTQTGAAGEFVVPNLLPGMYSVKVEAHNFKSTEQLVQIDPGSKVGIDFKLEIGVSTTVVEVAGSAASVLVNTETQTLGQTISNQTLMALPIADTRNPYSLVVTSGNVSEDDPSGRGTGVAINGLRSESTNILLDGAANNDEFSATAGQYVPLDSVQEYSLLTSNFTSEYGRAGAGVVNLTTKSGTNNFHGTAYEYNRVSKLASNDFNNNAYGLSKGIYDRNQFGYSVGGPVKKDKLFFFQSTEWTRIRSAVPIINMIPDPSLVALAAAPTQAFFSQHGTLRPGLSKIGTYTRGDLIAAGTDPCAGTLPSYFTAANPCATLPDSTPMFDEVAFSVAGNSGGGAPQNTYDLVGRADWNISDKTTFYGRYARYSEYDFPGTVVSYSPYAGYDTPNTNMDNSVLVSMTHTFSATLVSQSKLVFNRLTNVEPFGKNADSPTLYFGPNVATNLLNHNVAMPGYLPYTPGNGIPFGGPQNFVQLYQDMSKVHGSHDFRFGGSYTYIRDNRTFGAYQTPIVSLSTGSVNILGIDDFLNGTVHQFEGAVNPQGKFPCADVSSPTSDCTVSLPVSQPNFSRSNRYNEIGTYGQDSWKVTPRFTLNLGLRWEYFGVQHNKDPNLDSNFYYGGGSDIFQQIRNGGVATVPTSPIGGLWKKDWHNFGPRLGFAWDVFGNGKTSIRGGWGISYIRNFGNVTFNVIQNPPNYAVLSLIGGIDLPTIDIPTSLMGPLAGSSGTAALPSVSLRAVNPNIGTAYAHDYSFGVQREVARNVVVDLEYSGSKGVGLYDIANINRYGSGNIYLGDPCPAPGTFPDCYSRLRTSQYTNINFRSDKGFSRYNSFNGRLNIRDVKGVNFVVNYTWSHAIDNLSDTFSSSGNDWNLGYLDPFNPKLDSGDAQFDNRHRIAISGVWAVPFAKSMHGAFKQAFDGWSFAPIFTARTGNPYSIFDCWNAVTVCPRGFETTAVPSNPQKATAVPGLPNTYSILNMCSGAPSDFTGCSFWNGYSGPEYANAVVGYSDFGPFPGNMSGRDAFRTPGDWNMDFSVHKQFFLTERYNLEFRAEMFNMFNHANLIAGAGSAEVNLQPYIPAYYSGNRNIQLALRFQF